jgi:hypothetical protein
MGEVEVTILAWTIVLYFYMQNGHVQVVHPDQTPSFASKAECEANAPQVRNFIHLWQGEKSFAIKCQQKR